VDVAPEQERVLTQAIALLSAVATIAFGLAGAVAWSVRHQALRRLYETGQELDAVSERAIPQHWLARWLSLAGYRRSGAAALFAAVSAASAGIGLVAGQFYRVALLDVLVEMVANVPGGAGELLAAVLTAGPWILFVGGALLPTVIVRTVRRARVRAIEQDLPLVLELFATMGEAGLGFDAALAKIVRAQEIDRPLIAEFVNFQLDLLAGIPRLQALRQLARRIEIGSVTAFTSSLVQAEQVGASMAETLRHQADDLRERRREHALLQAQALPVKLVFPLVICFLPGIFASTLAPVIYQMIQVAGGALGGGR
jgi:tight adherence protein C